MHGKEGQDAADSPGSSANLGTHGNPTQVLPHESAHTKRRPRDVVIQRGDNCAFTPHALPPIVQRNLLETVPAHPKASSSIGSHSILVH